MKKILLLLALVCAGSLAHAEKIIWTIGTPDDLSMEFAPNARDHAEFNLKTSTPSRDFPAHQLGAVDAKEKPYAISFDLGEVPQGQYQLDIDFIFHSAAPAKIKVVVNERNGIFPLRRSAKIKGITKKEENEMLLTRSHLVVSIDAAWLKEKGNKITLVPLGAGSLHYDALALKRVDNVASETLRFEPTIFYPKRNGVLRETCEIVIPFKSHFQDASATVQLGKNSFSKSFTNSLYDFGVWTEPIEIPANTEATHAEIQLSLDGQTQLASSDFKPAKKWKVFICPKVHNDVGYTDLQPHVNELDNRNTDTVLDVVQKYPFYKFNFETSWLVDNYLDCRTAPFTKTFYDMTERNRVALNGFYLNLMTGVCSGEELYRSLYFTHRIHRDHGGNFDTACLTDAPSHSWFLPSLLHDCGIKAFSNGSNQTRAPILHNSDLNENSPYYWEGMNGERILMWYAISYRQLSRLTGSDGGPGSSFQFMQSTVPQFLTRFIREDYAPDATMIYGAYVDNAAVPKTAEAPVIEEWNRTYEFPKLIVATDGDYFNYIEKNFADRLPVYRGDCGAYWEDGVGSSSKATTLNRQSQQILPSAEIAATFATIFAPRNRYPAEDFWGAWRNVMFYDEHTWGAHNSISQPDREFVTRQWEIKEAYATRANLDARNLLARGFNRLCQNFAVDANSIIAFNFQNWMRSAPLEVDLDHSQVLIDPATGKPVPLDVISDKDGWRRVRFVAENVPPVGYKCFNIRHENSPAKNEKASGETIENNFYRLTIDLQTGGLKSLFDKTENRELLDTKAAYKMNELVYAAGGENSRILNHNWGSAPVDLKISEPTSAKIVENIKTPFGRRITISTTTKNLPEIRSEYLLYDTIKRVDIVNTLDKDETRAKEAVYFAFPFAAENPAIEYQIQNGWVRPNEDQMPGGCREWFTSQNLVHVRDGEFSVAWSTPDAPLFTLCDINRGLWPTYLKISNGHVFSYVMNNYWFTNYRATQGGKFRFAYSLTSGRNLGREELARFDADTRTPVIAYPFLSAINARIAQKDRPLSGESGSLMKMDTPNLQVVTFKAADDGDGYVLRVREIAGRAGETEISFPTLYVKEAFLCNGVEENKQKLAATAEKVKVPFKANQFVTIRLRAEEAFRRLAQR